MKAYMILILVLYKFCINTAEISCHEDPPKSKTCYMGTMNPFSDFEELTKCTAFVDKTLIIEEFFKRSAARQFHLITCPPKFGKSTNLDAIRKFIQFDEKNQQLFNSSNQHLKITPLLHEGNEFLKEHFQNHKCIYISFKNVDGNSLEKTMKGLTRSLSECYNMFKWEKEHFEWRSEYEPQHKEKAELMSKIMDPERYIITEEELVNGLSNLLNMVAELSPNKTITILIDDYDDPIRNAIEFNFDVIHVTKLMERIFSTIFLTFHPNLHYTLITGTLDVLNQEKFSHIKHWNFLDNHHFVKYFGFTSDDVDYLLNAHSVESNIGNLLKQYYKGYSTSNSLAQIYNPYSITCDICSRNPNDLHFSPGNYWASAAAGRIHNFLASIKNDNNFREIIAHLLTLKKITFKLIKHWNADDLEEVRKITHDKACKLTVHRINLVLSYLFHNGYLSHADKPLTYCTPNEEIQTYLNQSFMPAVDDGIIDVTQLKSILSPPS